jgi:hypothetical protein
MCTTYTDYYRCGHVRGRRLVRCDRRYEHALYHEWGHTSFFDCNACSYPDYVCDHLEYRRLRDPLDREWSERAREALSALGRGRRRRRRHWDWDRRVVHINNGVLIP